MRPSRQRAPSRPRAPWSAAAAGLPTSVRTNPQVNPAIKGVLLLSRLPVSLWGPPGVPPGPSPALVSVNCVNDVPSSEAPPGAPSWQFYCPYSILMEGLFRSVVRADRFTANFISIASYHSWGSIKRMGLVGFIPFLLASRPRGWSF